MAHKKACSGVTQALPEAKCILLTGLSLFCTVASCILPSSRNAYCFTWLSPLSVNYPKDRAMSNQTVWQWYQARDREGSYSGPFESREAAIAEGRGEWDDEHGFWVAEATNPPVKLADWIGAEDLLERADESIFDNDRASQEWDDAIFEASTEQQNDLKARVIAACEEWQKAHGLTFQCSTFEDMRNVEFIPGTMSAGNSS